MPALSGVKNRMSGVACRGEGRHKEEEDATK